MIYPTAQAWKDAPKKRVCLFAMSGLGKTYLSCMLREAGDWFHYSVDYRIGTRYMGEHITDNFKREAMKNPFLADLLRSDSIYVASNITFENLAPLSTYLGKPGDPAKGGLPFAEYQTRQNQHRLAEQAAMLDTVHFIDRAQALYDYDHFICDTSGSICEVLDPEDPNDDILTTMAQSQLMVWIKGDDAHREELERRFDRAPKPMYYRPEFLAQAWTDYLTETELSADKVNPDAFVRWTYARALSARVPRYAAMAEWGVTVDADDVSRIKSQQDFVEVIADAIDAKTAKP